MIDELKSKGLIKGGNYDNALVFKEKEGIVNGEKLTMLDEPIYHKILDMIGDSYLLGVPIIGNFFSHKGGHELNGKLITKIMNDITKD